MVDSGTMTHAVTPACPRCGYDLSGQVASWTDRSPLRGVCSECGLELRWGLILHPTRSVPRWSIEHGPKFRIRAAISTFFRSLWPWTFWKAVRMEQPIQNRRLIMYMALLVLLTHFGFVLAHIFHVAKIEYQWAVWNAPPSSINSLSLLVPIVQKSWQGAVWPYSKTPWWQMSLSDFSPDPLLWGVPVCLALVPCSFVLLPVSTRKAHVRKAHLVRGYVYATSVLPFAALAYTALIQFDPSWYRPSIVPRLPLIVTTLLYSVIIWTCIVKHYLRMSHAVGVSVTLHTIATLLTMLLFCSVFWSRMW